MLGTMDIYQTLDFLRIKYKVYRHRPVFTVKESLLHKDEVPGERSKSLLMRNKNKSAYYLVIISGEKRIDQNELQKNLKESRLSFASPEELRQKLGTTPGSVSPYALINNKEKDVLVLIDEDLLKKERVYFHPETNSKTLETSSRNFKRYLESLQNKVVYKKF
ncbi:aminoacyl-tRNA deacylase [Candidatus Campbellbacteria bacterium CG22_combo_CG10-13_8_21_14_all_43_18]|uniref:Aminoacyl-tRNA deacylase n=1 Tax=Candidatus Campbellbacteria bacterium CG22_combo_CG10-13_8_21_14_all_43_18 TaxID=1974530 RepID=A0A2H0DWX5_9BACT|nr:MAG: aminoacyl-tRNA deacylase [Candidatus Campbellbacteria bacterium CG22_combo_CG10-13_8_21_14_all_43_18]